MDQTLKVDLIMIKGTMPKRTFRIEKHKPTQQVEKLKTMPLSSNRAERKTTLSNLGLKKKLQTSLILSTQEQRNLLQIPTVLEHP